jgi:vacuolar-type H+-ATPase subunit D/Vma8
MNEDAYDIDKLEELVRLFGSNVISDLDFTKETKPKGLTETQKQIAAVKKELSELSKLITSLDSLEMQAKCIGSDIKKTKKRVDELTEKYFSILV